LNCPPSRTTCRTGTRQARPTCPPFHNTWSNGAVYRDERFELLIKPWVVYEVIGSFCSAS